MTKILIKNGKTVTDEPIELLLEKGKISQIGESLTVSADQVIDLQGNSYVSPGWIDSHVHCYEKMDLYYDFPDEIGVKKGVTTVVDAGSTGALNIGDFYQLAQQAKTNVYALLNISETGIVAQNELSDMAWLSKEKIKKALMEYPDFIVGYKARMSKTVVGNNDVLPLDFAKSVQKELSELPLMVHIGSTPPELEAILSRLESGDIVTHCFNGKANGILDGDDQLKSFAKDAYQKGIIFDIGHGTDSFNFHVAKVAFENEVFASTISTDIYHRNRDNGPVFDLATTLEKLLLVGYTLEEVIGKVTEAPAKYLHFETKGKLAVGYDADITIFDVMEDEKILTDSNGNQERSTHQIKPRITIVGGTVYELGFK